MYLCIRRIDFVSVSTIFLLDFEGLGGSMSYLVVGPGRLNELLSWIT
jgi:hypothetical protein